MENPLNYTRRASGIWECLRCVYNQALILEAVVCPDHVRDYIAGRLSFGYWGTIVLFVLAANAFFSLGPFVEMYGAMFLHMGLGRIRYALFAAGLYVSMAVINPCVVISWSR